MTNKEPSIYNRKVYMYCDLVIWMFCDSLMLFAK